MNQIKESEKLSVRVSEAEYWREATVRARCEAARWHRRYDALSDKYNALWCASLLVVGALLMVQMGAC